MLTITDLSLTLRVSKDQHAARKRDLGDHRVDTCCFAPIITLSSKGGNRSEPPCFSRPQIANVIFHAFNASFENTIDGD
jgi:hypothetical protein